MRGIVGASAMIEPPKTALREAHDVVAAPMEGGPPHRRAPEIPFHERSEEIGFSRIDSRVSSAVTFQN
ncbi:MAG: hypothetical protein AB7P21_29840 [Lautropia sp.]